MQNNPYAGPRSIGGVHHQDEKLYGRDREVGDLLDLVITDRIVLLYSPSGAGKTSLLQAGLIPALRRHRFTVRPIARVHFEPPPEARFNAASGNRYTLSVLLSLEEALPKGERTDPAALAQMTLAGYLDAHPRGDVLIIDQFEEVLSVDPTDQAEKVEFFGQLGDALRARHRWAVLSMREDYLARCDAYLDLIPTRLSNTFRLDLLNRDAAVAAMRGPALDRNVEFAEDAAKELADNLRRITVLSEGLRAGEARLGAYVEPVQLQVVCRQLWDHLPEGASTIGREEVARVGNVDEALATYYDEAVARAAEKSGVPERSLRDWFNDQLITPRKTRSQASLGEPRTDAIQPALKSLRDRYVIRTDQRLGSVWYELAHDRLVEPVLGSNQRWFDSHLQKAQKLAVLWGQQQSENLLLTGADLQEAQQWAAGQELLETERRYLAASADRQAAIELKEQQEKRLRFRLRIAVAAMAVALALGVASWYGWRAAAEHERDARENLAASDVQNVARLWSAGRPAEALASLARALRANPRDPAAYTWAAVMLGWQQARLPEFELEFKKRVDRVAFSGDGRRVVTAIGDGDPRAQLWDVETGKAVGAEFAISNASRIRLNFDGSLLFASTPPIMTNDLTAQLHRTTDGSQVDLGILTVEDAEFSKAGKWLLVNAWTPQGNGMVDPVVHLLSSEGKAVSPTGGVQQANPEMAGHGRFSKDGTYLVVAEAARVRVWNLESGKQWTSPRLASAVLGAGIRADNQEVALVTAGTNVVQRWSLATGRVTEWEEMVLPHPVERATLSYTPKGQLVVTAPGFVSLVGRGTYSLQAGETAHYAGGEAIAISGNERITLRDAETFEVTGHVFPAGQMSGWAVSQQAGWVAVAAGGGTVTQLYQFSGAAQKDKAKAEDPAVDGSTSGKLRLAFPGLIYEEPEVRDAAGKTISKLNSRARISLEGRRFGAFSRDGQRVAVGDSHGDAQVFEVSSGKEAGARIELGTPIERIVLSPDGRILFTATADRRLRTFEVESGALMGVLEFEEKLTGLSTSADGRRLLVATATQRFGWDLQLPQDLGATLADLAEAVGGYRIPEASSSKGLVRIPLAERRNMAEEALTEPRLTELVKRLLPGR